MHCPSCGQQQVSNETKFCSRCGFPLGLTSEVLSHGGFLPQLAELNKKNSFFNKKNGVVFAAMWFIFFTMFCTSFLAIVNAPDEAVAVSAITGVFGSLMLLIGSLVFLPSSKIKAPNVYNQPNLPAPPTPDQYFPPQNAQAALPPPQSIPVEMYRKPGVGGWRDTNEFEPHSVTDDTTRLLSNEEDRSR